MATSVSLFLDTIVFSAATAVFTDIELTTKAPDGFYVYGTLNRQQLSGLLQTGVECSTLSPCNLNQFTMNYGPTCISACTVSSVSSVEFSDNNCIILYGPLVGGTYTDNCSGTITVIGTSAQFRPYAYLAQNGGNVSTSFNVVGISPGSYAEQNPNSGIAYGNYITLTPGTYSYNLSISMFNGVNSEGGIEWTQ